MKKIDILIRRVFAFEATGKTITQQMEADQSLSADNKIEANLNFGMSTAKQLHCVIQPQIMPNLLDHSLKRDLVCNHAPVVIGSLLGSVDAKIIDISNCFPMTLKTNEVGTEGSKKA